jgi:dihydrofolate reductase
MRTAIIYARQKDGLIGIKDGLPWGKPLKFDMENFKALTGGQVVVMGRSTFESLGSKPLRGRVNFVVTRTPQVPLRDPTTHTSLIFTGDIDLPRRSYRGDNVTVFYIGGAKLFEGILALAKMDPDVDIDDVYETEVDSDFECAPADATRFRFPIDQTAAHPHQIVSEGRFSGIVEGEPPYTIRHFVRRP